MDENENLKMDKINVVEIITSIALKGGAECFVYNLCKELANREDVNISLIILGTGIEKSFEDLLTNSRLKVYFLNRKKSFDLKCARKLRKLIKNIKPDVINSHLRCVVTFFLAFGCFKKKFKYFHTLHNVPLKEATKIDRFLKKILLKFKSIYLIAISKSLEVDYKKFYKTNRVSTILLGISSIDYIEQDKEFDFVCVARFRPQKNHKLLIESFNEVWKEHNEITMVLAGDGQTRKECEEFTKGLPCKNNIKFLGVVTNPIPILLKSKFFVLSSEYEGTPVSVLEAMSCGNGLILPKVGGIPDIVSEENAFLYKVSDKNDLVKSMLESVKNKDIFNKQKKKNLLDSKSFTISNCANLYLDLYKRK